MDRSSRSTSARLVWDDRDTATLPDGRTVSIHSEHVRYEGTFYWPMLRDGVPDNRLHQSYRIPPFPTDRPDGGTKRQAKAYAQAYADYLAENAP